MAKDKRMLSEKELARWREQYKNAGRPCLCAELLDHIDAQAERIAALEKAVRTWLVWHKTRRCEQSVAEFGLRAALGEDPKEPSPAPGT